VVFPKEDMVKKVSIISILVIVLLATFASTALADGPVGATRLTGWRRPAYIVAWYGQATWTAGYETAGLFYTGPRAFLDAAGQDILTPSWAN
jgi:hypothetical protein